MNIQGNTLLFLIYCICSATIIRGQDYRNSGFIKPMRLPFNLAGSFGEPRPDHFHSGIDIKTNGVEGEPVLAIGNGYISRIRVSPYGYGKAIYITHPNGFTSVYGHLSRFYGKIEAYIHAQHYRLQASELDLTLDSTVFPLRQNDTIAFSGNTGGSTAPHLHFEIRNTKTEHALNPLDFYPKSFYVDTIPPQINKVKVYQFEHLFYDAYTDIFPLHSKGEYLTTDKPVLIEGNSRCCISLEGFDKQDHSENKNGIKRIEAYQNGALIFKYDITEVDFDKTRMCNAFVDYHEMMNDNGYFYNCYQLKNNSLPLYTPFHAGFITLNNSANLNTEIHCYDYNNNLTTVKLTINKDDKDGRQGWTMPIGNYVFKDIKTDTKDSIVNQNLGISFPEKTFYDDLVIQSEKDTLQPKTKFEKYKIFHYLNTVPLQKSARITIKSSIKRNRDRIVIVRQDNKGKETALKTTFDKTTFYADTRELGTFYLEYDITKPEINITSLKSEIISVRISDNLSGIVSYNGYIDNHWVNLYYDAKNDVLLYKPDEYCPKGEHLLKIIVTDNVGNKATLKQKFIM